MEQTETAASRPPLLNVRPACVAALGMGIGVLLAEFDPGEYQATGRLVMPDGGAAEQGRSLRMDRGPQALEFQFDNLTESTGIYSFFLALTNPAGNVKIFAANAVNSPEPPDRFGE